MTENIHRFRSRDQLVSEQMEAEAKADVMHAVKQLMAEAEAGALRGIAFTCVRQDGSVSWNWAGGGEMRLNFGMTMMQHHFQTASLAAITNKSDL